MLCCEQKLPPPRTHQLAQLRQLCDHILPVAWPVCAWVACEEQLLQVVVGCQAGQGQQACLGYEVDGEVQPLQGLTALQVLNLGDVVDGKVEVLQVLCWCFVDVVGVAAAVVEG